MVPRCRHTGLTGEKTVCVANPGLSQVHPSARRLAFAADAEMVTPDASLSISPLRQCQVVLALPW